jgi:hypothetical protein
MYFESILCNVERWDSQKHTFFFAGCSGVWTVLGEAMCNSFAGKNIISDRNNTRRESRLPQQVMKPSLYGFPSIQLSIVSILLFPRTESFSFSSSLAIKFPHFTDRWWTLVLWLKLLSIANQRCKCGFGRSCVGTKMGAAFLTGPDASQTYFSLCWEYTIADFLRDHP